MIKYTLACEKAHDFEVWFGSSADYDEQKERGLLSCPFCGSTSVDKALMAPRVTTGRQKEARKEAMHVATTQAVATEMVQKMRDVRDHIHANTEDVGDRFAQEARDIHYGDAKERGIRGQASAQDVAELRDEGVEIAPVPVLPEEAN